jgi:eukaryotic-like serine/threonine-protein kinase
MTPERAREIERICEGALERPVSERAGFLADACAGDSGLRRDVERLLAHDQAASAFLETSAMAVAAHDLAHSDDALAPGQRFGPYTIVSRLGAGGMGEVYRARDTTLGREVAIKVLPALFTGDPERLARLEREARVLAALNHPNIATIHGLERVDGVHALVLEVVEGKTLEERLRGASILPMPEALGLAKQIAEALEAAHEHGVVHRDLKPANIKIRPDGVVKVLDFGLAKVVTPEEGRVHGEELTHSPNASLDRSHAGLVLGTAAYMSPEQAQGKRVDRRTDIWAFGLILYEMLTGRRGFGGETTMEVLSNVLKAELDWTTLPPTIPPVVRSLLRRSLQKDPARRLRDIADARFQIEEAINEPGAAAAAPDRPARSTNERWLWVAALIGVAAAVGTLAWMLRPQDQAAELRLEIVTPPTTQPTSFAVSPDGRQLVFVASDQGQSRLWVRPLNSAMARPLGGTENARFPFWSPDNRSVGFSADEQLKRVDVESGHVRVLSARGALGGTWNRDGNILFDQGPGGGLFLISADGGGLRPATRTNVKAGNHLWPEFLPDHRHFLFYSTGSEPGIYVGALGTPDPLRRIVDAEAATYAAASAQLLFVRAGTLFAQPFDPVRLELTGSPAAVAEQIAGSGGGTWALSASPAGPIVYRTGPSRQQHQFVWFDRAGARLETVAGSDFGSGFNSSLSHDGRRLAMDRVTGSTDIWALDVKRGVPERLTIDPAFDLTPIWSPDDRLIAFTSNRRGPVDFGLFMRPASSSGVDELLVAPGAGTTSPTDWSLDGRVILYSLAFTEGKRDIWAMPLHGDRKPFAVVATPFNETSAQFSPDGQWIAYQSNESGSVEIYVQRYPSGRKLRISADGGVQARWRRDGTELFYLAPDNRLVAVPIRLNAKAETVDAGKEVPLFATQLAGQPRNDSGRHYMVSPDGQRFLMDTLTEVTLPITVILNWKPRP